jgi:hypothetical protein
MLMRALRHSRDGHFACRRHRHVRRSAVVVGVVFIQKERVCQPARCSPSSVCGIAAPRRARSNAPKKTTKK